MRRNRGVFPLGAFPCTYYLAGVGPFAERISNFTVYYLLGGYAKRILIYQNSGQRKKGGASNW